MDHDAKKLLLLLIALEIGMYLLLPLSNDFGARFIYVSLVSGVLLICISLVYGPNEPPETLIGIVGFPFILGIFFSALSIVGYLNHGATPSERDEKKKAYKILKMKVFSAVKPLVNDHKGTVSPATGIRNKIMLLIDDDDQPINRQKRLSFSGIPFKLAKSNDAKFTVAFIKAAMVEQTGSYDQSKKRAYKVRYDIYYINWPEKVVLGMESVKSDPPKKRGYSPNAHQWGNPDAIMYAIQERLKGSKIKKKTTIK